MEKTFQEITSDLSEIDGVEEIKTYVIVCNYGATFRKNGKKYDLRRWANLYGADCGWGVHGDTPVTVSSKTYAGCLEAIRSL